jgi:hypothetical protein
MKERYKNLPEDDQVNEIFDQKTGELIYDPYKDKIYKEWQARNLDSNYFKSLHLASILEEKKVGETSGFGFGSEDIQKQLTFIHEKYLQAMDGFNFVELTSPFYSKYHKLLEFYLKKMSMSKELLEYEEAMLFVLEQYKVDIVTKESVEAVFAKIDFLRKRQKEIEEKGYVHHWEEGDRQDSRHNDFFTSIIEKLIRFSEESIHILEQNNLEPVSILRQKLFVYMTEHYEEANLLIEDSYRNQYLYDNCQNIDYAARKLFNIENENVTNQIISELLSELNLDNKIDAYNTGTKLGKRLIIENILNKDIGLSQNEIAKKLDELIDLCLKLKVSSYDSLLRKTMLTDNTEQLIRIAREQKTISENVESNLIQSKVKFVLSELKLDYMPEINHDENNKIDLAFLQLFSGNDIPFAIKTFFENGAKDADYGAKLSFIKNYNLPKGFPIAMKESDSTTFKSQLGLMLCYIKLSLKYEVKTILSKLVESFKSDNIMEGKNNDQTKLFDEDTFQSLNRTISCYYGSEFSGISCYFLLVRLSQDLNADKIDINYVYEEIVHNILGYKLR